MHLPLRLGTLPASLLFLLSTTLLVPAQALDTTASRSPDSGLVIEHTRNVTCSRPTQKGDMIAVHYRGTLLSDGSEFDQSYSRGVPFTFRLGAGKVIKGWDQGLLDMCIGEARKLTIPPELAYGNRGAGRAIPPAATLVFETELIAIKGVVAETKISSLPTSEPTYTKGAAGSASTSTVSDVAETVTSKPVPVTGSEASPKTAQADAESGECRLLGPFALVVQGALGVIALLVLVFKRYRERPRRPLKIWFFDVSKQVVGSILLHLVNLFMSMLSSGDFDAAHVAKQITSSLHDEDGRSPNPCSFYLLNLAIDTTIGIPILVILLKVLHNLFLYTALANPPESIKSGNYGQPARVSWWMKQSLIYFIGLFGMKLCVFFLFQALPWIAWVGDWALRWTEGNEALQIAFVMFIFPVLMNAIQYYIIDGFIKDKGDADQGFEAVPSEDSQEGDAALERTSSEEERESIKVIEPEAGTYDPEVDGEGSLSPPKSAITVKEADKDA